MSNTTKFQCIGTGGNIIYKIDSVTGITTSLDVNFSANSTIGGTLQVNTINVTGDYLKNGAPFVSDGSDNSIWTQIGNNISYTSGNVTVDTFTANSIDVISITSNNLIGGNVTIGALFINSIGSHFIPSSNEVFDLGNQTNRWRDLYLSGNTIYLGDSQIKTTNGNILFENSINMSNFTTYTYDHIWTSAGSAADNNWVSVCWAAELELFCAVSESGSGNRVMTSTDGINWTTRGSAADNDWQSVCWAPELTLFCAVASSGTGNRVMTSSDGITWTTRGSAGDNDWRSVTWSPDLYLFCAVASGGTSNRVMTSPDGFNWTIRTSVGTNNSWQSVCWSKDLRIFCAVGNYEIMTSTNGLNWTLRTIPSPGIDLYSITWSPELHLFCAVGGNPSLSLNKITSSDGVTWTLRGTDESVYYRSITWSSELGLFCAVTWSGVTDSVTTSPDGINWTTRTAINRQWRGISWSPELSIFSAVAVSGTGDRVMTSSTDSIINSNQNLSPAGKSTLPGISFIGNNNTGIFRPTIDAIGISNAGVETMRITSSGNLGINVSNPLSILHIRQQDSITGGGAIVAGHNLNTYNEAGLVIEYGAQYHKWSISSSGFNDLLFSWNLSTKGYIADDITVGNIDFTGQHRCSSLVITDISDKIGYIVKSTGDYKNFDNSNKPLINESLPLVELTSSYNDKSVFGVISDMEDPNTRHYQTGNFISVYIKDKTDNRIIVNSLGEGAIWVCNVNDNIENGDYITSCIVPGIGMKQNEFRLCNFTVAKATCNVDFDDSQLENKLSVRYFLVDGSTITKIEYISRLNNNEQVYIGAFIGCTYHCG